MAIDQTPSTSPTDSKILPAIDNEFPTYRAISPSAVLSVIFGVGSVFCFADLWFLLMAAGAVALGLHSLRKIKQLPDVLTGAGLARMGIGIALLFGLSSITHILTQEITINLDAGEFARDYINVIKTKPVSEALWYQQPPGYRKGKNPDEIVEEMKKSKSPMTGDVYLEKSAPIVRMKEMFNGGKGGGEIEYSQIESKTVDGLTTYANALIKVEGPGTPEHPEKELYALFQMVKGADAGRRDWIVNEIQFPYKPKSAGLPIKPVDDGHGHAGGH